MHYIQDNKKSILKKYPNSKMFSFLLIFRYITRILMYYGGCAAILYTICTHENKNVNIS